MDHNELATNRRTRTLANAEDAISLAIVEIRRLEQDAGLNGRRQDVTALRNRLSEALEQAGELREGLVRKAPEITESVDEELAKKAAERNGKVEVET